MTSPIIFARDQALRRYIVFHCNRHPWVWLFIFVTNHRLFWFHSFRNKLHLSEELGKCGLPKSWCSNGRPTCPRMLFVFNPINPALSKNWDPVWMFNKYTFYTQFTSFRIQPFSYKLLQYCNMYK